MENNKYNNYYSTKTIGELIIELERLKLDNSKVDWYVNLEKYLHNTQLNETEKELVSKITNELQSNGKKVIEETKCRPEEPNKSISSSLQLHKQPSIENVTTKEATTTKIQNAFDLVERNKKALDSKMNQVGDIFISINKELFTKVVLYISFLVLNVVLIGILTNNIGVLDDINTSAQTRKILISMICLVDLLILVYLFILEFSIINKIKDVGECLKKSN